MATITFWGKPACQGNARQRAVLQSAGHTLQVRDLGAEPWTAERLRPFFGDKPVHAWFNQSAPSVKRAQVRPETLTEEEALALLIAQPLLIRRPLLESDGVRIAGFDTDFIAGWIGLAAGDTAVAEGCVRPGMPPCHSNTDHDNRRNQ